MKVRNLVRDGNIGALETLYDNIPQALSELIRTAFIPRPGYKFIVADFSAIEARVLSHLAGEQWRMDLFAKGGDIYCQSASEMFHVPVVKNGINGHLRQKGKVAELACIAENEPVLTDRGLVPIQNVTTDMLLWDGENWVHHDGVVYRGEKEVITYEGLTATEDHIVWIEGKTEPVRFGDAATCGAHLVQTGNGRRAIRLGKNHLTGKVLEPEMESLFCSDTMCGLRNDSMARLGKSAPWKIEGVPAVLSTFADSTLAGKKTYHSKTALRKSKGTRLPQLWCPWYPFWLFECTGSGAISDQSVRSSKAVNGDRPDQYEWRLLSRQHPFCIASGKLFESETYRSITFRAAVLAILPDYCYPQTVSRHDTAGYHRICGAGSIREKKELADHKRTARLYDIRNAGQHNRYTVSGHLVHNCGYGGSVGALKAMGALEMGLTEDELQPLVTAWRNSNPHIVHFWWDVDSAVKEAVASKTTTQTHCFTFRCHSGMLFIDLPSGRSLAYVKPKIGVNKFGSESVTYEGINTGKWMRIETYGPRFAENITQAVSRDILCNSMKALSDHRIVAHVHDELIIECPLEERLEDICLTMGQTPDWMPGLVLRADGYECEYYKKD